MTDPIEELFTTGAPPMADAATSAAALHAIRPGLIAARAARRRALGGAALVAATIVGGGALALSVESIDEPLPLAADVGGPETFESPGGTVTARLVDGELDLVRHLATPGYQSRVLEETLAMLTVQFSGPEVHVIALAVEDDMIVETDVHDPAADEGHQAGGDGRAEIEPGPRSEDPGPHPGREDPPGHDIAPGLGNDPPSESYPPGETIAPGHGNEVPAPDGAAAPDRVPHAPADPPANDDDPDG